MIKRLESKEIGETMTIRMSNGKIKEIIPTGIKYKQEPTLEELVEKVNEVVDKLNEGEKQMETKQEVKKSEVRSTRIPMSEYMRSMRENLEKQGIHLKDIKVKFCMGVPEDYILIEWEEENPVDTLIRVAREVANEKLL